MSSHPATLPIASRHLPVVVLLVLALLWAQLLGLAHGVRHAAPAPHGATAQAAAQAAALGQDLLAHLAAPAGEEQDCRLYDQLGHGAPLLQLPLLPAAAVPVWLAPTVRALLPAGACAAYAARAPPVSR